MQLRAKDRLSSWNKAQKHLPAGRPGAFYHFHPAIGAEIRRFGKQEPLCGVTYGALGVRDADTAVSSWIQLPVSWEGPSPRVPVVLELCQWDEGRGLTSAPDPGSVGYPGDRVFDWSQVGLYSPEISKGLVSPGIGGSSQALPQTPMPRSPLPATSQVTLIKV